MKTRTLKWKTREELCKAYGLNEDVYEYVFGNYCNEGGDPHDNILFERLIIEESSWVEAVKDYYT